MNINSYQEYKTFLSRSYEGKNDFLKQYSKLYNEKEKSKQLYIQVLCELKVAVLEGNLKNFINLSNIFSYIVDYEKLEELVSYYHEDIYPFKGTNIIILACEYNRLEILKHIFSNYSPIYEHLFTSERKVLSPDDEDENLHNAFYYSIRANNVELVETLIKKWPGNYFDNTHSDELDMILSKAYEELKLKNVLLGEEIEVFIEEKLINLRFFSSKTTSVQNNKISLDNIRERIALLIEQINSLKSDSEVNEEFLFILKYIIQNIHTLKRLIRVTYSKVPWVEMEFLLVCFVLSFTQQEEINLLHRVLLSKKQILKHLANFASGLESIKNEIGEYKTNALSTLPRISRELNTLQIIKRNPEYEGLFSDYEKVCDIHTLNRISTYVTLASTVDVKTKEGQLVILRSLQVIGECLKNTLESPKLSSYMSDRLLLSLPRNTRNVVIDLRNSLSHAHSLSKRIEIQQNTKVSFFQGVQNDIKKIGHVIKDILLENKLKIVKGILETIVNANHLKEVEELIATFNIKELQMPEVLHLSECKKFRDIVDKLKCLTTEKTTEEEEIFQKMDEIINLQNNKLKHKTQKYSYGMIQLSFFNKTFNRRIEEQIHRSIKFDCINALENIMEKTVNPRSLKNLAELAVQLLVINEKKMACNNIKSFEKDFNNLKAIKTLLFDIICIAEIQMDNVQWVNELREQLNENKYLDEYQAKYDITKDQCMEHLACKILDLKNILKIHKLDYSSSIPLVKNDGKIIAALEMLILDILSILGQLDKRLEDSFFYLDQSIPHLIGKNLRNHLAHYNTVTDILPSNHVTGLILNAQIIADKLEASSAKIGQYVEEEPAKLKSKISEELKVITLKKKMFDALESGNLDVLKSCIAQGADIHSRNRDNLTTLHAAAKGGNVSIVKFLVDQNVNFDLRSVYQQNPLHVAAASGNADVVEYFIKQKFYNLGDGDDTDKTPLHLAALRNHKSTIEILLKHKADCSVKDKSGASPLHLAVQQDHLDAVQVLLKNEKSVDANQMLGGFTPLHLASEIGSLDVVNFLISRRANVNAVSVTKVLPLHLASSNGHTEVVKILVGKKSKINGRTWDGCTPLLYATENGCKDISDILLKNGANPNVFEKIYNCGPIHFTTKGGHVEILKALLRHSANTNVTTTDGKSPLDYAIEFGHLEIVKILHNYGVFMKGREVCSALHLAVKYGHIDIVEYLINQKVGINTTDKCGNTPLHYAAFEGHGDVVTLLIERNAKVNARNASNGYTPLLAALCQCIQGIDKLPYQTKSVLVHIYEFNATDRNMSNSKSLQHQHEKVIDILLKSGADANAKTVTGTTALHFAAASGNCSIVNMLLQRNVSVNQRCKQGFTPMHSAVMFGHKQIVELLLANNAKIDFRDSLNYSALHFAVEYGHKNIVKLLLANNADINESNREGWSPVAITLKEDRVEILKLLIENGGDVHEKKERNLSFCLVKGSINCFKILLKYTSVNNDTQLLRFLLYCAIARNYVEAVTVLIAHGVDVNKGQEGCPPLLYAVDRNHEKIVEILLKNGANINGIMEPGGLTALQLANTVGNVEIIEILLKHGIKDNARIKSNSMALHLTIKSNIAAALNNEGRYEEALKVYREVYEGRKAILGSNHADTLKTLHNIYWVVGIQNNYTEAMKAYKDLLKIQEENLGSDHLDTLNTQESMAKLSLLNGKTISVLKIINNYLPKMRLKLGANDNKILFAESAVKRLFQCNDFSETVDVINRLSNKARTAASKGDLKKLQFLIVRGFDINDPDEGGRTLIHYACNNDHVNAVLLLLNSRANVTSTSSKGNTPLHIAALKGHEEIVKLLLSWVEREALVQFVNAKTSGGNTALHGAAEAGHYGIVQVLLAHGANFDARNKEGKAPVGLSQSLKVIELLETIDSLFENVRTGNKEVVRTMQTSEREQLIVFTNVRNRQERTLLQVAISHKHQEIAKEILRAMKKLS